LRTFTVYGEGDQHSSASMSSGGSAASGGPSSVRAAEAAPMPTPATPNSAYRAGIAAESRPGVTDHVSQVNVGAADGVNNFR
jgi:hypothetical protein